MPDVAIILGSESDWEKRVKGKGLTETLDKIGLSWAVSPQISAHRHPDVLAEYCEKTEAKVIIAAAGLSAALPGAISGHVLNSNPRLQLLVGVALTAGSFGAIDSLMSQISMPPGVPIAFAGADGPGLTNAAIIAAQAIATDNPVLQYRIRSYVVAARAKKPPMVDTFVSGSADPKPKKLDQ